MPESESSLLKPVLIFLGSGSGGLLRYWLGGVIQDWWKTRFPVGTLLINVMGCLVMGFLVAAWSGPVTLREEYRAAVLVGFLGGYTTFSSFGRDALTLVQDGDWLRAGWYILGSVVLSLMAVWLGAVVGAKIFATE